MTLDAKLNEVQQALLRPSKEEIKRLYYSVLGKELNTGCGDCYSDAKIELQAWVNEQKRMNVNINLFINRYASPNLERQKELDLCFEINSENKFINKIIEVQGRKYNDFFEAMQGFTDDVNIISNSDIFFNETIELAKSIKEYEAFCIGRWDYNGNGHADFYNVNYSQDVWIIRGKPKSVNGDLLLGVPGCDNRIAHNLKQAGYMVRNPSQSIQCIHYHQSNFRTYKDDDRLPEPYLFVKPSFL